MRGSHYFAVLISFVLMTLLSGAAHAAAQRIDPGRLCVLASPTALDPLALLANPRGFDCRHSAGDVTGRFTYGLVSGFSATTDPADPWLVRHEYSQAAHETLYVRYADGSVLRAPADRKSARRLFSPGMSAFALPARPGRIVAVLIAVEGLQNQRGVAPAIELVTGRAALNNDLVVLLLYGLLAGTVLALLVYNLALYAALRYSFIFSYCLNALAMLATGLCWSGGIFLLLPELDTTTQISMTTLSTSLVIGASAVFMLNFIEREFIPKWGARLTIIAALVGIAAAVLRLIDVRFAWLAVDRIGYWSMIGVLVCILLTAGLAWRSGSRAARVYLIAWTVPILLAAARIFWAIGLIDGVSTLIAMSPLILMAIEAVMSALAVSWRIGLLRAERDEARALHAELRVHANTDPLTLLLNRRAFIDGAFCAATATQPQRLILIDIDQFKAVNDRFGHQQGDDVLVAVAQLLRVTAPATALVGRLGGEEFAVLVPAQSVDALADRLCRAVAAAVMPAGITLTISAGVADGAITDDADWRRIYHAADQALYRAKHGGRNRVSHALQPLAA